MREAKAAIEQARKQAAYWKPKVDKCQNSFLYETLLWKTKYKAESNYAEATGKIKQGEHKLSALEADLENAKKLAK